MMSGLLGWSPSRKKIWFLTYIRLRFAKTNTARSSVCAHRVGPRRSKPVKSSSIRKKRSGSRSVKTSAFHLSDRPYRQPLPSPKTKSVRPKNNCHAAQAGICWIISGMNTAKWRFNQLGPCKNQAPPGTKTLRSKNRPAWFPDVLRCLPAPPRAPGRCSSCRRTAQRQRLD